METVLKQMESKIGVTAGLAGGMTNFLMQMNVHGLFMQKLLEAGLTAFICGALGAAGKHLYDVAKLYFKNKKKDK